MNLPEQQQTIWVYHQDTRGLGKIEGIRRLGGNAFKLKVISVDAALPSFIEETDPYLPDPVGADLVLDYLLHPDLNLALAEKCKQSGIPLIASGKKQPLENAITPRTCCALTQQKGLGNYGKLFGLPEYRIGIEDGRIASVETLRGAPCGATWDAGQRIIGYSVEEAPVRIGLETQFYCVADPASWDPITGKSPVHIAGELHKAALLRALKKAVVPSEKEKN
jgi:hypothetical protein